MFAPENKEVDTSPTPIREFLWVLGVVVWVDRWVHKRFCFWCKMGLLGMPENRLSAGPVVQLDSESSTRGSNPRGTLSAYDNNLLETI